MIGCWILYRNGCACIVPRPYRSSWPTGEVASQTARSGRRTLAQKDQRDGDLETALAMMNEHGTLVDTIARAQHYGAMAKDALGIFPKGELREALINIVDFCIERAY